VCRYAFCLQYYQPVQETPDRVDDGSAGAKYYLYNPLRQIEDIIAANTSTREAIRGHFGRRVNYLAGKSGFMEVRNR
jgi:hypothetical protein